MIFVFNFLILNLLGHYFFLPVKAEKEEEKENEDEEGDETSVYCKLSSPSENVYMSTTSSKLKKGNMRQIQCTYLSMKVV